MRGGSKCRCAASFTAGPSDALDGQSRLSGFLGNQSVLFFDNGAHTILAIETAEDLARNAAVGSLRAIDIEHVEQFELRARRGLPCHDLPFPPRAHTPKIAART